ncbi:hypothetical protein DASC09_005000 [Saccharomycopsis crataegensis]|uniref:LSM domain-containing protein n=1 Tax=Saccharomycopsis crataegensis TaxID=43959 RepID=A0AAV5QE03_9ASCO|nr:hypothetical protein DASC09_005000 [Saccharomycopsis crataegensis]
MSYKSPFDVFFGLLFQITLNESNNCDGCQRVVAGNLLAVDFQCNLLINNTMEYLMATKDGQTTIVKERYLGMLSVPQSTIEKIEVETNKYERFKQWQ